MNIINWLKKTDLVLVLALILLAISLGTILDFWAHELDIRFSVADSYFTHKIFYGTLWGFVGYLVFRKYLTTPFRIAFAISAVPAALLQIMYYIQGHLLTWVVILFLILHFFMFFLPALYLAKRYRWVFVGKEAENTQVV